ncbi:MAG: hypothetical protein DRG58_04325 [Deltaproteobacteria bacterium]|nr:MAG: hypothetical protein DRG58_04325 [Deltaproteobacteria bacterium]
MSQEFYPLSISALEPGQELPFSIYLRAALNHYFLYLSAREQLSPHNCQYLNQCKITTVFVPKPERSAQIKYLLNRVEQVIQSDAVAWPTKVSLVYDTAQQIVQEALLQPLPKNIRNCQTIAKSQVQLIISHPEVLHHLLQITAYDYYTHTHSVNVCFMLVALLHRLNPDLSQVKLNDYGLGALLHDIGKTRLDKEILNKPGKLTPEEYAEIKKHPVLGVELVRATHPLPPDAENIILQHHEDLDGSGYPFGLGGDELPLISRLARIVDIYDALTTRRPYRPAMHSFEALALMWQEFKGKLDHKLLQEFIKLLGQASLKQPGRS